jgi:hypothetical protein
MLDALKESADTAPVDLGMVAKIARNLGRNII